MLKKGWVLDLNFQWSRVSFGWKWKPLLEYHKLGRWKFFLVVRWGYGCLVVDRWKHYG